MKKILGIMSFLFLFLVSNCFAVTFTWIEVISDNRGEPDLRFSSDLMVSPGHSESYDVSFSAGGAQLPMNYIYFGADVYDSGAVGKPSDYEDKVVSWNVTDSSNPTPISATATIPPLARKVELSTDVTVSGKPTPNHPTVSWKNLDPSLSVYRLRVVLADDPTTLLWQTTLPPSAQNMSYTICGFSFQPEVDYLIRIEARQLMYFPVAGTGLETMIMRDSYGNPLATFMNRSTVFVNYAYDTPDPTEDVYIDSATGLEWLIMNKTVCKSPDSIKNGTDGDNLADQGWVHATNQQITDLLINAGMNPPFTGTYSPWNYDGAKFILDVLGHTSDYTDSMDQESFSILAFAKDGPPSAPGQLYTALIMIGHMQTGDVGGALIPALTLSSSVSSGTIGNWLVRPHDYILPTLAPLPDKTILWPPNHQMVTVSIAANASDNSGRPVILEATVSSNEPENGLGDGDTAPDWTEPFIDQEGGIITLQLRAERSGKGNGRVYTVMITATDESGNTSQANVDIKVPHDQRKK